MSRGLTPGRGLLWKTLPFAGRFGLPRLQRKWRRTTFSDVTRGLTPGPVPSRHARARAAEARAGGPPQSVEYLGWTFSPRIFAIALFVAIAASPKPTEMSVIFPS